MNRRNSDTAKISSGVTNANSIRKLALPDPRPRQWWSDKAKATPSGTVISAVSDASFRLCTIACWRLGSFNTDPSGSQVYQRSEKPVHWVIERELLNENSTASATGIKDHNR